MSTAAVVSHVIEPNRIRYVGRFKDVHLRKVTMKKLLVIVVGLVFVAASCAPGGAIILPTEAPAPADSPAVPTEAQRPTATAEVQETAPAAASRTSSDEAVTTSATRTRDFQPQLERISIDLNEVVTLLPPDAIPAILPERARDIMVSAAEAETTGIDPNVQVLGVEINGESRAYPIPYLSAHEIVNDTVGGRQIAVTW